MNRSDQLVFAEMLLSKHDGYMDMFSNCVYTSICETCPFGLLLIVVLNRFVPLFFYVSLVSSQSRHPAPPRPSLRGFLNTLLCPICGSNGEKKKNAAVKVAPDPPPRPLLLFFRRCSPGLLKAKCRRARASSRCSRSSHSAGGDMTMR